MAARAREYIQRTPSDLAFIERAMQSVTSNSPLPPSVEAAYYRKCIELKRRINEIEDSNDVIRTRKARVERSIMKLRLERAFLLEQIAKRMEYNVDDSDQSDSPAPTVRSSDAPLEQSLTKTQPQDKPLRSKRGHRKTTPPATSAPSSQQPTPAHPSTQPPTSQFPPASSSTAPALPSPEHPPTAHPSSTTPSLLQPIPQPSFPAPQPPNLNGTQATHNLLPLSGQGNLPPPSSPPQPGLPPTQTTSAQFGSYDARAPVGGSSEALANGPPGDVSAAHQSHGDAEVAAAAGLTGLRERQNGDVVDTEMRDAAGFTAVNR